MPIYSKFAQNSFVLTAVLLALASAGRMSFAEEMSMDAFHAKFQEATGKPWESATAEERQDFVHQYQKTAAETLKKTKLENLNKEERASEPGGQSSNLKREVNVQARKQFLEENGKPWEEGTAEEQEAFLKKYKEKKREGDRLEKQKEREEQALERTKEDQKKAALRAIQEKKRAEEAQKLAKKRAWEEKKKAEKEKLEERMLKLKEMREELKRKHK